MPVRGATASFIMIRICSSSREGQERTWSFLSLSVYCDHELNSRWNCTFVENGASSDTRNDLCFGIWSVGNGPLAAKLEILSAVITTKQKRMRACVATDEVL